MALRQLCIQVPEDLLRQGSRLADESIKNASACRDEARRLLLQLLDERQFHFTVFMARKFFFNAVISTDDLAFFMKTVRLAMAGGHPDVNNN